MEKNEHIEFYLSRAELYYKKGDGNSLQKAIELFSEAITRLEEIEDNQLHPEILLKRAHCKLQLFSSRKFNRSAPIEDIQAALDINPNFEWGWYLMGFIDLQLGNTDKAIDSLSIAIELNVNYSSAYFQRGLAHQEKQEFSRAINDLSATIRLEPNNAVAFMKLADSIPEANVVPGGRVAPLIEKHYQNAARIDPNFSNVLEYKQQELGNIAEDKFNNLIYLPEGDDNDDTPEWLWNYRMENQPEVYSDSYNKWIKDAEERKYSVSQIQEHLPLKETLRIPQRATQKSVDYSHINSDVIDWGRIKSQLNHNFTDINQLGFSPDGNDLVAIQPGSTHGEEGFLHLIDIEEQKMISSVPTTDLNLALSSQHHVMISWNRRSITRWNIGHGKLEEINKEPFTNIRDLVLSEDGKSYALFESDVIRIFQDGSLTNVMNLEEIYEESSTTTGYPKLKFSSDFKSLYLLATIIYGVTGIYKFDLATMKFIDKVVEIENGTIDDFWVSETGSRIITWGNSLGGDSSSDPDDDGDIHDQHIIGSIVLHDVEASTSEVLLKLRKDGWGENIINDMIIIEDGNYAISRFENSLICSWDFNERNINLIGGYGSVFSLALSNDHTMVAVGGSGEIRLHKQDKKEED